MDQQIDNETEKSTLAQKALEERVQRIRKEYEKVRSQICNCSWNPDSHADECPVNVLDRVIIFNLK